MERLGRIISSSIKNCFLFFGNFPDYWRNKHTKMVQRFTAKILTDPKYKNSAYVEIPFDVYEVFGQKNLIKVKASFDGVPYRGSIAKMGGPVPILIIRKDIRAQLGGKGIGDTLEVTVEKDTEERIVEVPEELQTLLDENPKAKTFYEGLAYTYRKEYARWISSAKREATKLSRLEKTLDKLLNGVKAP